MDRASDQTLRFAENLSLPTMQVIVIRGSTGRRVSDLVTRMNESLLDYAVDLRSDEVVLRGVVDVNRRSSATASGNRLKGKPWDPFGAFRCIICFRGVQ